MKKKHFLFVGLLVMSIAYVGTSVYIDMKSTDVRDFYLSEVEALASDGESSIGARVVCYCAEDKVQTCVSNGDGAQCASGRNIHCDKWNTNCR